MKKLLTSITGFVLAFTCIGIVNATPKYSPTQLAMNNKATDIVLKYTMNKDFGKWSDFCKNNFTVNGYGKCISYSSPTAAGSSLQIEYINYLNKQEYNTINLNRKNYRYFVVNSRLYNPSSGKVAVKVIREDKVLKNNPNTPVEDFTYSLKMLKEDNGWVADDIIRTQHNTYTIPNV